MRRQRIVVATSLGALIVVLACVSTTGLTRPEPPGTVPAPAPVEVSAARRKLLRVFTDGKGHYLAFPRESSEDLNLIFLGDGKTFYRQRGKARSQTPQYVQISVEDFRSGQTLESTLHVAAGHPPLKPSLNCGARQIEMTELPAAKASRLMAKAELRDVSWQRFPRVLARDSTGSFYLVDWLLGQERRPRVFAGRLGHMKQLHLKSFVSDAGSETYLTGDGALRLQLDPKDPPGLKGAVWRGGGRTRSLTLLEVHRNDTLRLIWQELGVYGDLRQLKLQRPCDLF